MSQELRSVIFRSAAGNHRLEKFGGEDHLVVPVIALVEGVIQAMNAKKPELVLAEKFSVAPSGWNGRPVFLNHPMSGNSPVSGNSPEVLESSFGKMFNTNVTDKQMHTEAWINLAKAEALGGDVKALVKRIRAAKKNDIVEISVGAFITLSDKSGKYNGVEYDGVWDIIVPDHLALLQEGYVGACSTEMGCGVRAAGAYQITDTGAKPLYLLQEPAMEGHWSAEFRTFRNIPQSERDKMPAKDFAGPNRSFPIAEPEDVDAAASSLGRLKGGKATQAERDRVKRKIITIAYRKGDTFVAKLPEDWKKSKDQKPKAATGGLKAMLARSIGAASLMDLLSADEMSDNDVREELQYQLSEVEPGMRYGGYVVAFYPAKGLVIYSLYEDGDYCLYRRSYTLDDNGDATIADDKTEVNRVISYEPVSEPADEGLAAALARVTALAGARHSSKDQKMVQAMHDTSVSLGADCAGMKASSAPASTCGCGKNRTALEPAAW